MAGCDTAWVAWAAVSTARTSLRATFHSSIKLPKIQLNQKPIKYGSYQEEVYDMYCSFCVNEEHRHPLCLQAPGAVPWSC